MLKQMMTFITVLLICNPVFAEPLEVWGNGKLPPMGYVENDIPKGFGVEITKAILNEAGIKYKIIMGPWKRAYEQAKTGKGIVFGMYWTEERSQIFDYTEPLWVEDIVIVTKKGKEFPFQTIEDLRGKVVSMQRGTRPGTEFAIALKQGLFKDMPNNDPKSRLRMIHVGRVDAGIFNPGVASVVWNARLAGILASEFTVLKTPLAVKAKHIGIAKFLKRNDLIQRINPAIQKLKKNGTLDEIMIQYESEN